MAETLKRTFHGCLTCRKRKVRCLGGNPCQNCSRMNITCHSSFETNLRIRVSTPTGQKVVDTKPDPIRGLRRLRQPPAAPTPASSSYQFDAHHDGFSTTFQSQFTPFSFPPPPPPQQQQQQQQQQPPQASFPPSIPSIHQQYLPSQQSTTADINHFLYPGMWGGVDFSCLDPNLEHGFNTGAGGASSVPFIVPPTAFNDMLSTSDASQFPTFVSENDVHGHQVGTKEWVPKRRRRNKKVAPKDEGSDAIISETAHPDELSTHEYGDFAVNDNERSMQRFVADFVQKSDSIITPWYNKAEEELDRLMGLPDPGLEIGKTSTQVRNVAEHIIFITLFVNHCDVLSRKLGPLQRRLHRTTHWLSKHPDVPLPPLASKIILGTCYFQIRLNTFIQNSSYTTSLLDVLVSRTDYSQILRAAHNLVSETFGYDPGEGQPSVGVEPSSLRFHESICINADIIRYRVMRKQAVATEDAEAWQDLIDRKWWTIDESIRRLEGEFELASATDPSARVIIPSTGWKSQPAPVSPITTLSQANREWLSAYMEILTVKIIWSRLLQAGVRTDPSSTEAAELIIQSAMLLRKHNDPNECWQYALGRWSLSLFTAGVETIDEVRADWVRMFLSGVAEGTEDERSKGYARKLLELMDYVRRREDETGQRVSIEELVIEKEGIEGMFMFLG
ncbi:hypothetical protein QBC35DRAFT_458804 [Podospora australis]|uniref:Zn(2)-C6 fungal-type domain-containing protein n=1 Tax=Podospora australis TaxID=1536484 RepID=A0AAN6X544_9PEZI|nr:hypothetical protein QBC35DRAFT_458804 [Podospora australis]